MCSHAIPRLEPFSFLLTSSHTRIGLRLPWATALTHLPTSPILSSVKIVGKRPRSDDLTPVPPDEALRRAAILQAQAELLNPFPRPRGFVFKAKTREEYERWRKAHSNPRLW